MIKITQLTLKNDGDGSTTVTTTMGGSNSTI